MTATDPRVDAYIAARPEDQRAPLESLRADVARLAAEAEETISYGMPAFKLDGRFLLSYAGWKAHCTVYPIDEALLARHADAIRGYRRTKGGLHFSAARPLPPELVEDLVRGRVEDLRRRR